MRVKLEEFAVDPRFQDYFEGRIKQVFLYVTDNCNLTCTQCLYKPWLRKKGEIPEEVASVMLAKFRDMGAIKLSLIGGEPTLYGYRNNYKQLLGVVKRAKSLGYEYIRLDTNGLFSADLLRREEFKLLDEITFSIDSHICEVNDALRGVNSFGRSLANLIRAIDLGYRVDVTCCVHKENVGRDQNGNLLIESMIRFAETIGVNRINFHPLFRMGIPRDEWAGEIDIPPELWVELYAEIREKIDRGRYNIKVRIPQRFISEDEFEKNPDYYGFCPVKDGERVLVHPNGLIQICALRIGTPYAIAKFDKHRILWEEDMNELNVFNLHKPTSCTNQHRDFGSFVPPCISFKPKQDEIIWRKELQWEKRRK